MGLAVVKGQKLAKHDQDHLDVDSQKDTGAGEEIDVSTPVKVHKVHIDGVARTETDLVTKQVEPLLDVTSFEHLIEEAHNAKLRLQRLGVFNAIEVFVDTSKEENLGSHALEIYFLVKESKRLTGNAGTNVGNNEGNMAFGCKLNNLRGKAEFIRGDISIGTRVSSSYELCFGKPMLNNPNCKLQCKIYRRKAEYPQSFYQEDARGLESEFTIPSPVGMHSIKWEGVWRENCNVPLNAPFCIREQCGHSVKSAIKHVFTSDGRDHWVLPTNGSLLKHVLEYAGIGGDTHFVKSELELQVNKEIIQDFVLGLSFQTGAMKDLSNDKPHINDRFFLGGPLSIRGFKMKGIGSRVEEASLGANTFWATGAHLYTPLPFRPGRGGFGDLFRLHFFANAGNLMDINLENNGFRNNLNKIITDSRYSYGLGIMLMLGGIARLEINYCIPRNTKPTDGINPGLQIGVGLNFL